MQSGPVAIFGLNRMLTIGMEFAAPKVTGRAMILNTIAEKLKRQSKDDFKGSELMG